MGLIGIIKNKLTYTVVRPLIYDESLRSIYSTVSVCGGMLHGKTAVVTGATSGIGYATAQRLLSEGCNVIIAGRNEGKLKESVSLLHETDNAFKEYLILDALSEESINESVEEVFNKHKIDIWVNCAGIYSKTDRARIFRGITAESYFDVVNTNLKSNVLLIPHIADAMFSQGIDGRIITVSSICGLTNHFGYTPYGISKNGVIEFTKQIAEKYNGRINILTVAPGSVATRMGDTGFGKNVAGSNSFTRHVALPEETASVIAFLASPICKYLNGQTILASAGEQV